MKNQIIAVDFDGTLCKNAWPDIGFPHIELINYLIRLQKEEDAKLILWTCRVGKMLDKAVAWCEEHGLIFNAINCNLPEIVEEFGSDTRKIFANWYIDDRNFYFEDKLSKKVLYLCDREKCKDCSDDCKHTTDVWHAKNFSKEFYTHVEKV
ncbi:MAG: hypothetical protein Q4B70_19500 [Lachnospiraceae bacterium]|nr:hypothetical protein [Lachnospiraceae bacterium]